MNSTPFLEILVVLWSIIYIPITGLIKFFSHAWYSIFGLLIIIAYLLIGKFVKLDAITKTKSLAVICLAQIITWWSIALQFYFEGNYFFSWKVGFPIRTFDIPTYSGGGWDVPPIETLPYWILNFLVLLIISGVILYFIPQKYLTKKRNNLFIITSIIVMLYWFGMMTLAFD